MKYDFTKFSKSNQSFFIFTLMESVQCCISEKYVKNDFTKNLIKPLFSRNS